MTRLLTVKVSGHLALLIPSSHSHVLCSPSPCSTARPPPCSQVTIRGAEWQAPLPQRYVPLSFYLPPVTASAFPIACLWPAGSGHVYTLPVCLSHKFPEGSNDVFLLICYATLGTKSKNKKGQVHEYFTACGNDPHSRSGSNRKLLRS